MTTSFERIGILELQLHESTIFSHRESNTTLDPIESYCMDENIAIYHLERIALSLPLSTITIV
jgi:hypothetical protein